MLYIGAPNPDEGIAIVWILGADFSTFSTWPVGQKEVPWLSSLPSGHIFLSYPFTEGRSFWHVSLDEVLWRTQGIIYISRVVVKTKFVPLWYWLIPSDLPLRFSFFYFYVFFKFSLWKLFYFLFLLSYAFIMIFKIII